MWPICSNISEDHKLILCQLIAKRLRETKTIVMDHFSQNISIGHGSLFGFVANRLAFGCIIRAQCSPEPLDWITWIVNITSINVNCGIGLACTLYLVPGWDRIADDGEFLSSRLPRAQNWIPKWGKSRARAPIHICHSLHLHFTPIELPSHPLVVFYSLLIC